MNFYSIYDNNSKENNIILIKEGFNWYSLLFGVFWAIYKGIWDMVGIYAALFIFNMGAIIFGLLAVPTLKIGSLAFGVMIAFYANDFYKKSLERKGYKMIDLIAADSEDAALLKLFERKLKTRNS